MGRGAQPLVANVGAANTFYLTGLGPIAEQTAAWTYYLRDAQRSTRQLTDGAGTLTLTRSYTPWGELLRQQGSGDVLWGYFGGQHDSTTGLIYMGSGQYYDPETGRLLSPA